MIRRIIALPIILLVAGAIFAQGNTNNPDYPLSVDIQFHDQRIYYETDEVFVKVTLTNNSPEVSRFRIADNKLFSLDFAVQTLANQALSPSEEYIRVLTNNESVFTRDVSIRPNEQFSFLVKLNDFKKLPAGVYVVSGYFYPELRKGGNALPLPSNRLSLSIKPDSRRERAREDLVAQQVQQILKAQALAPDQVIEYMLQARMKSIAEQFFLYIDLEELYVREPANAERYRRLSEMDRIRTLGEYKTRLYDGNENSTISMRPDEFEIIKTEIQNNKRLATVEVLQKYKSRMFTELKYFKYRLEKQDQIWYVIDYTVINKGTE